MTPLDQAIEICHIAANAIILWLAWHCLWRRVCQERLRQNLFELRDQLFDYARSGNISFNESAYVMLRLNINSMIRFAHLISATRIFTFICLQRFIGEHPGQHFQLSFKKALNEITDKDVKSTLLGLHEKMYNLTFFHLLFVSPHILVLTPVLIILDRALSKKPSARPMISVREKDAAIVLIELQANEAFKSESFKRRQENKANPLVAVG